MAAPPHQRGRSLAQAVATGVLLLGLVALAYGLGDDAFFVLVCAVVAIAVFELARALVASGRRVSVVLVVVGAISVVTAAYLSGVEAIVAVLVATVFGAFLLSLRPRRGASPATDVAWTVLAVAWIGGGGAAVASMLTIPDAGRNLIVAFVLITAIDDIAAYFAGTRFGRHKMAPSISPSKSWEGLVAGLAAAVVGGVVFAALLDELTLPDGLAVGAICGLFAPAGDLVESMAKREIGIKDSGGSLPGHGGFLDRVDAIIFCAPPVLLYFRAIAL